MSDQSLPYAIHSDEECERLELQARLGNIQDHLRHLSIPPHSRILDVGCGSGSMARLIAKLFPEAHVIVIDVRPEYVDFARERARHEGLRNVAFQSGDALALPFENASFDVVWAKYLLQWVRDPKGALAEMKRVTKPGGAVVSCDYVGFLVDHFPIASDLESRIREVLASIIDYNIGRKVAPLMIALGFNDVRIEIEADTLFTVVGRIDDDRRRNLETQFQAIRPYLVKLMGSETEVSRYIERFLAHYDDPATCSYTSLHFTTGQV
jgi:ubiquinone/menaquinone biosynthesis C-methylase UbiE